jgi:hypothetical protein
MEHRGAYHVHTVVEGVYVTGTVDPDKLQYNKGPHKWANGRKPVIIYPSDSPSFKVREPADGPPIFVGDFYEHPEYIGVVVIDIAIDERTTPVERIVTYRAATRQDLVDHGML